MTRKHYRILANMFYQLKPTRFSFPINRYWKIGLKQWRKDVIKLTDFYISQDPEFSPKRFLKACDY